MKNASTSNLLATTTKKMKFICTTLMLLSALLSYGQRPANSQPRNTAPKQLSKGLFNNLTNPSINTAKKSSPVARHLQTLAQKGVLSASDTDFVITSEHVSSLSGVNHIYFRQAINGIEVVGTEASLHITQEGSIAKSNDNNLIEQVGNAVKSNTVALTAPQAIQAIATQMNYGTISGLYEITDSKSANATRVFTNGGVSGVDIPVKQAYYVVPSEGIKMIWEIAIQELTSTDWWNFYLDAGTGTIIDKYNLTTSCNILDGHDHRVQASSNDENCVNDHEAVNRFNQDNTSPVALAADGATYNVYAVPTESPYFATRSVVVDPADPIASPFGWHDTNGITGPESTTTSGNNTLTVDDINANNTGGTSPDGGTSLVFDFPIEATQNQGGVIVPLFQTNNRSLDAAIANTFYWTNIIHDITYYYGFDEASGNFQVNNYGNGGLSGDAVQGDVQDGSDTCNANFGTPQDGFEPRMQMFICGNNDSAFDNAVIVHEYAHGISNRLTGGAGNSGALTNQEQQGEGWSDYYGYMYTMSSTNFNGDRAIGTFLANQGPNGAGIRSFPYSGNTAVNDQDYQDLINIGDAPSAPHPIGEIWASMLYDLTQDLIEEYGFDPNLYSGTGGNNISLALVTEGLKLQPSSPGFVDSRDAILLADQILYGGANECIIWESFASRGLGFSADQGNSNSRADGTAAFDVPPITLELTQSDVCLANGSVSLGGGITSGGTYSGPGVTDNGDGTTFTFDPTAAGEGVHTITYQATNCSGGVETDTDTITVTNTELELSACPDVTLELGPDGTATYDPFTAGINVDLVGGDDQSGSQGFTVWFVPGATITQTTLVSFDWELLTAASDQPGFDSFGYILGTTVFTLSPDVDPVESGTFSIEVPAGQNFGFAIITADNTFGAATATVSNFSPGYNDQFATANWQLLNQAADGTAGFSGTSGPSLVSCGDISTSLSQSVFTCLDIGTTTAVTITVTDSLGNEDTCTANVTVTGGAINTTTFSGGAWNNGDPTGNSMAIINDAYDSATMGDINACSCEINTGQTTTIRDGNFMNIAGNITVNGTLIVENAGSIVQIDENAITTNNGTIEVRKTTPELGGRDFTVLSSPMSAETRNDVYQNANRAFEIIPSLFTPHPDVTTALNFIDVDFDYFAQATTLAPGQGFLVFPQAPNATGTTTLDHTYTLGTLNSGTLNYSLVYNGPVSGNNFNLVGNPYASAIDTDMLIVTNDAINEIYYWEHLTPPTADNPGDNTINHSMDDISIYNLTGGIAAVNGGTAPGRYMASGQGFGILADQDAAGATLDFTNAMRVSGNNGTVRVSDTVDNKIWLQLSNQNGTIANTTLVGFLNEATATFDKGYDSQRLDTNLSLYSILEDGQELSIQGREAFDLSAEIQLGLTVKSDEHQEYTIAIYQIEGAAISNAPAFLKDHLTGIITNLKEENYSFSAASISQPNRFTLYFNPEDTLSADTTTSLNNAIALYPTPSSGTITLSYQGNEIFEKAIVTDVNGKQIKEISLSDFSQSQEIDLSGLAKGMYFMQINTKNAFVTKKILLK